MMMNHMYQVRSKDVGEDDVDILDLAPLESSLAPIVTVPAAEDIAEDEIIPALESDHF